MSAERPDYLKKGVIGMVHLEALPGTPKNKLPLRQIIEKTVAEAQLYHSLGVNAIALENMHDIPYVRNAGPEIVAAMSVAASEVRRAVGPQAALGVQVLAANNKEAISVAHAAAFDFVRVEGFVFGHVADEGYIDGNAGDLLRFRKAIGADSVRVFADIKKKHSAHSVTADVTIGETAHAAEYFLADGVIVTGESTGKETDVGALSEVCSSVSKIPVLVGSGCTAQNVHRYLPYADALIVGSHFKEGGYWENPVSSTRVSEFMTAVKSFTRS